MSTRPTLIFVVAESVNALGGAPKSTRLLCEGLAEIGVRVRLFVRSRPDSASLESLARRGVSVVTPAFARGSRWELPQKLLATRVVLEARLQNPHHIISVGLISEARNILRLRSTAPVSLWETTEALPHVKFVDKRIAGLLSRAAEILVPSETIERNVRMTYGYQGMIRRLPFWVAPPPREPTLGQTRSKRFVFLGRLDLDKGFQFLFEAFREVRQVHPSASLAICGTGQLEAVRKLAEGDPAISFLGHVQESDFGRIFSDCDAVVLPSLHEGYPLSLLDACGRGRPIIATTVGSIPEVFGGRACAILVPPRDSKGLASAMNQLLDDDDVTYRARGADALQLFEEISSPQAIHERLATLFLTPPSGFQRT